MAGVDYSKWDKLKVDDDDDAVAGKEAEAAAKPAKPAKKVVTAICGSCRAEGAKLRCTVCKKTSYCSRNCQKSDWRFHKRVCKKPAAKKKDAPKKPKTGGDAKAAAAAPAPAAATKPKPKKSADSGPTQAELDAEDEEIVKSLKSYGYFHRDANARRQVLNDLDTTPELLESKQADSDDPQPVKASNLTSTSAWNTAGTWEERNMTSWAKSRLEELLVGLTQEVTDGHIELKELTDWEGDASIPVIRGRPRFLYDFTFKAKFDVMPVGSSTAKKVEVKFTDFCCDEDEHDMAVSFVAPKPSALHQAAVRSVMERPNGLLYSQINAALEQFVTDFKSK